MKTHPSHPVRIAPFLAAFSLVLLIAASVAALCSIYFPTMVNLSVMAVQLAVASMVIAVAALHDLVVTKRVERAISHRHQSQ